MLSAPARGAESDFCRSLRTQISQLSQSGADMRSGTYAGAASSGGVNQAGLLAEQRKTLERTYQLNCTGNAQQGAAGAANPQGAQAAAALQSQASLLGAVDAQRRLGEQAANRASEASADSLRAAQITAFGAAGDIGRKIGVSGDDVSSYAKMAAASSEAVLRVDDSKAVMQEWGDRSMCPGGPQLTTYCAGKPAWWSTQPSAGAYTPERCTAYVRAAASNVRTDCFYKELNQRRDAIEAASLAAKQQAAPPAGAAPAPAPVEDWTGLGIAPVQTPISVPQPPPTQADYERAQRENRALADWSAALSINSSMPDYDLRASSQQRVWTHLMTGQRFVLAPGEALLASYDVETGLAMFTKQQIGADARRTSDDCRIRASGVLSGVIFPPEFVSPACQDQRDQAIRAAINDKKALTKEACVEAHGTPRADDRGVAPICDLGMDRFGKPMSAPLRLKRPTTPVKLPEFIGPEKLSGPPMIGLTPQPASASGTIPARPLP